MLAWQVTLQTERTTLARLAKASMCTGYQLSNAELRLSPTERSRLSPAAAEHVAALEDRLRRLEQCAAGGAAELVSGAATCLRAS